MSLYIYVSWFVHLMGTRGDDKWGRIIPIEILFFESVCVCRVKGNRIGDEGARQLAQALKSNCALTELL